MPVVRRDVLLSMFAASAVPAIAGAADHSELETFTTRLLRAFENLDMPTFIDCFADDATVFFPAPEPPLRVSGRSAIQERFENVFAGIARSATGGPPFHKLDPQDLQFQSLEPHVALVSFHLLNATRTARRTLVVRKARGAWRIAHLHASNGPPV